MIREKIIQKSNLGLIPQYSLHTKTTVQHSTVLPSIDSLKLIVQCVAYVQIHSSNFEHNESFGPVVRAK